MQIQFELKLFTNLFHSFAFTKATRKTVIPDDPTEGVKFGIGKYQTTVNHTFNKSKISLQVKKRTVSWHIVAIQLPSFSISIS